MKTKNQTGLTIGIDLGDRRHTVCVLNAAGDIIAEEVLTSTKEVLAALYPDVLLYPVFCRTPFSYGSFEGATTIQLIFNCRSRR